MIKAGQLEILGPEKPNASAYTFGDKDIAGIIERQIKTSNPRVAKVLAERATILRTRDRLDHKPFHLLCEETVANINRDPARCAVIYEDGDKMGVVDEQPPDELMVWRTAANRTRE